MDYTRIRELAGIITESDDPVNAAIQKMQSFPSVHCKGLNPDVLHDYHHTLQSLIDHIRNAQK